MDIEDSFKEIDDVRQAPPSTVSTHQHKKKNLSNEREETNINVPGTQRVWLKTYGCSHNISDSEYMMGLLESYGYEVLRDVKDSEAKENSDIWVLNSCTVKDPSQAAFMHLVKEAKERNIPVVVAGCVSQADRNLTGLEDVSVIGITQIDRIVEAVEQTVLGNTLKLLTKKELPVLDLPKIRKNPLVEIIPLSTGCLGACTYCKTKQARGKLGSYRKDAIVNRVKQVIEEGVAEIWLSSEDTGAYGLDINSNIIELLEEIIAVLPPQGVMLRIGMTNPPYILKHIKDIARIMDHPCVYAFLHVPVQAGSNSVLSAMNREYTVEEYRIVADTLLNNVGLNNENNFKSYHSRITLATDIIAGFPNETEEDFDQTMQLIKDYELAITNISQFYPRPGTPAAKMKRIPTQIVKNRTRKLTKLFESFNPYQEFVGHKVKVYFDIEVSDDKKHSVGHTKEYVKVLVPYQSDLPGRCYTVKIISNHRFHIVGEVEELVSKANFELQKSSSIVRNEINKKQLQKYGVNKEKFSSNSVTVSGSGEDYGEDECCGGTCSSTSNCSTSSSDCCGGSCSSSSKKSPELRDYLPTFLTISALILASFFTQKRNN